MRTELQSRPSPHPKLEVYMCNNTTDCYLNQERKEPLGKIYKNHREERILEHTSR